MLKWASTEHLATVSARRPKKTIVIWLVALIVAFGAVGTFVEGTMTTEFFFYGNPESKRADTLLEERLSPESTEGHGWTA